MSAPAAPGRLGVGFPLHADAAFLETVAPVVEEDADWLEVAPETTWRRREGRLERNGWHAAFADLAARGGKPLVAHGLAFSLATPVRGDEARTDAWVDRLRDDHATMRFAWLSDHLGFSTTAGLWSALPLPLPQTDEVVEAVVARVARLREVVPTVAFENPAAYFALGDPRGEPAFLERLAREARCSLVLDLHNVWTQALALGTDPDAYVDGIDLDRVVEVHVSGGSDSDPAWLPSGRAVRLDSHDGPVPEPVWALLERTLPRCRNVRGLLLERMNGSVGPGDVAGLRAEMARARAVWSCSLR